MWLLVKVTLFCLVLRAACGHSGPEYQYLLPPQGELSEETLQEDAVPSEAAFYYQEVQPPSDGPYGSGFPLHPPHLISENDGEVNAREDIPRQAGREARFFHPFDVAIASRAIERRVHEALRDFSKKFDLQFPQDHLSLYPSGPRPPHPFKTVNSFNQPPPPPPIPLPFHPPPFPFPPSPFHPGNPNIPPMPSPPGNPHPPHMRPPMPPPPPGLLPFAPSYPHPPHLPPPLLPFPPPRPQIPPPDAPSPPHPGVDPDPSNQQPTGTQKPPTNTTDVWDILLPWWYPMHMRPPTTKPPPMKPTETSETGGDVPTNPEETETSTPAPNEQATQVSNVQVVETVTPASNTENKETTLEVGNEVEQPSEGGEQSVPDATTTTISTPSLQSDTEQETSETSTDDALIPLIGDAQGGLENEASAQTTEVATATEKETLVGAESGITTESSGNDDTGTTTADKESESEEDKIESTTKSSPFDGLIEEIKTIVSTANTVTYEGTTAEVTTTDSIVPKSNPVRNYLKSEGVFDTNEVSS